jgi:hypothetical protein
MDLGPTLARPTRRPSLQAALLFLLCCWGWLGGGGWRARLLPRYFFAFASLHAVPAHAKPMPNVQTAGKTAVPKNSHGTFKHLKHPSETQLDAVRKEKALNRMLSPCLPMLSTLLAAGRACVNRARAFRHELATMAAFLCEYVQALATKDPCQMDSWKMQQDRPPPVEPKWEPFLQVTSPEEDDLVVPSWRFETVKDAVEGAHNGARIYCRKGDHHWDGKVTIRGSSNRRKSRLLQVVGESKARLWGRWSISRLSHGSFKGVVCAYETEGVGWPCVLVRGDPWLFESCQLRASGAYSVMCAKDSRATLRRCGVGGMGGGPRRAISSVIIMDSSWCLIQHCQVEDTDYTQGGVRLIENGCGRLESSILQRNGYGVAVDNNAKVAIFSCTLRDNHHAAFMAGWEASNAEMEVRQCTVYGRVWHTIDRPGSLSECDNRFTVSSMTQASRDVAQDHYHTDPLSETEEDRSWHYGRNPGRLGYTASPELAGDGQMLPLPNLPSPKSFQRTRSFPTLRDFDGTAEMAADAQKGPGELPDDEIVGTDMIVGTDTPFAGASPWSSLPNADRADSHAQKPASQPVGAPGRPPAASNVSFVHQGSERIPERGARGTGADSSGAEARRPVKGFGWCGVGADLAGDMAALRAGCLTMRIG